MKPRSPELQVDCLPAEPQGKPKNPGVGSLSLPQQIFLTQELNQGLLHCRQILYQLLGHQYYQGSVNMKRDITLLVIKAMQRYSFLNYPVGQRHKGCREVDTHTAGENVNGYYITSRGQLSNTYEKPFGEGEGGNKLRKQHGNIYITICKTDSQWELAL